MCLIKMLTLLVVAYFMYSPTVHCRSVVKTCLVWLPQQRQLHQQLTHSRSTIVTCATDPRHLSNNPPRSLQTVLEVVGPPCTAHRLTPLTTLSNLLTLTMT